jgi:transcriptional regulator with XRE-family HTH domain
MPRGVRHIGDPYRTDTADPFGDRVKQARIAAGYTQENLARELCIARSRLAQYENGHRAMPWPVFCQLKEVLQNGAWLDITRMHSPHHGNIAKIDGEPVATADIRYGFRRRRC